MSANPRLAPTTEYSIEATAEGFELGNDVNAQNALGFAAIHGAANRGSEVPLQRQVPLLRRPGLAFRVRLAGDRSTAVTSP